jgi:hypothetical protein
MRPTHSEQPFTTDLFIALGADPKRTAEKSTANFAGHWNQESICEDHIAHGTPRTRVHLAAPVSGPAHLRPHQRRIE